MTAVGTYGGQSITYFTVRSPSGALELLLVLVKENPQRVLIEQFSSIRSYGPHPLTG